MQKQKVLIIEDETDINDMICHHLQKANYETEAVFDGEGALRLLKKGGFDLIVLDILLPDLDGWELCRLIRSMEGVKSTPVIFVSALSSEADRIKGFNLGCDDYLIKPFSPRELVSRVAAILRRKQSSNGERTSMSIGNLDIDLVRHQIHVKGKPIHLTNSEFRLLYILVSNRGRVYSRDELLSMLRHEDVDLELGNIDVHIHHLRRKLEEDPKKPQFIKTVWGVGYQFVRRDDRVLGAH